MKSMMHAYKTELSQRYWVYQMGQFPNGHLFFDRPQSSGTRPPVFRSKEAWRNVIFEPSAGKEEMDRLLALLPERDRHMWFRSMNSSQALALSVFGNLVIHSHLSSLSKILDDDGLSLFGRARASSENFALEYHVDYLGEPRPTSLDGYISGDYRVAIECKFTEAEIGTCSRPRLAPAASNYERDHCDGSYGKQRSRSDRCSLTEAGLLYWRYIPKLFLWEGDRDWKPCPLAANYQLVRNILAVGVNSEGSTSFTGGHAVLIYDLRNPVFQSGGEGLTAFMETRQALREPSMLRKCSWQRIIDHIREMGILSWLTEQLALKYGI